MAQMALGIAAVHRVPLAITPKLKPCAENARTELTATLGDRYFVMPAFHLYPPILIDSISSFPSELLLITSSVEPEILPGDEMPVVVRGYLPAATCAS